ncbi:uncharacterized protein MYCFIDRAFT_75970 [Pseudocercospora fijiensis CIRAD86]|uniref:C3HC-type domain-containing protein n=1 Tax=Pseudocercospora fijiensis (strain CIRAD86) TaxID=383855 RepID=N1Q8N9_PSEFD|nr:uncharacterized protein MYCFIDRAFT_75970 [Pseudocercospora fijiensis CIRAD86]EME88136.1 hypothetical protein MYCFIDRAFT_75970 [Pseudocercospora fijiensis CIRAD86]
MPEAIATTKRKFYKALDALTSTAALPAHDASTSSKKRTSNAAAAFDEARERARKRLRHSASATSLDSTSASVISLPRKLPNHSSRDLSKPPPQFSPWSQDTFLARLKTFSSVSQWHPKPDPIGEVEWAKRGWVCVDVNTVACKGGCEHRLVVSMEIDRKARNSMEAEEESDEDDDAEAEALEEALADRYREEIVEGHSTSCLWHKAGCKDDIYRLPVVRPSIWQPELRKRFRSLRDIGSSISKVKIRSFDDSSAKVLKDLPTTILEDNAANSDAERAFTIAMHGWRGSNENELLECDACFQRIGLWMYQPDYRSSRRSNNEDEVNSENFAIIDLVELHRDHCPWRNPTTQKASGSLSGLHAIQILHRVVSTCARDHRRRSQEHEPAEVAQDETPESARILSREEIIQQDQERESRLRKLKNLFSIKRRSTTKTPSKTAA